MFNCLTCAPLIGKQFLKYLKGGISAKDIPHGLWLAQYDPA